ncbi:hypothetical protein [Mumia sp. ZJ430]|uniref:hypothetical protein n=1 Tax=Mumia sp. ZJ430 TaxID=2708083 RepID=UPI0014207864|nr:hypothetical protein [Mumia sp. ZJ430]
MCVPDVTPVPAEPADATAVRELVRSAYAPYVPQIGQEPAPMTADYVQAVEDGDVHIVRDAGELVVVVTRGGDDHAQDPFGRVHFRKVCAVV